MTAGPAPQPQRHRAYLASALTQLSPDERRQTDAATDVLARACSETGFDLYQPRLQTDPVHHPEVPDHEVFRQDRERVGASDLLILLADYPSFGAGQELMIAEHYMVPILTVAHSRVRMSRMVSGMRGIAGHVTYGDPQQLRESALSALARLRSQLPPSDWKRSAVRGTSLGARIRRLRAERGWSQQDLVSAIDHPSVDVADVEAWEHSDDLELNPSLVLLTTIANALGVDRAALIDVGPST